MRGQKRPCPRWAATHRRAKAEATSLLISWGCRDRICNRGTGGSILLCKSQQKWVFWVCKSRRICQHLVEHGQSVQCLDSSHGVRCCDQSINSKSVVSLEEPVLPVSDRYFDRSTLCIGRCGRLLIAWCLTCFKYRIYIALGFGMVSASKLTCPQSMLTKNREKYVCGAIQPASQ